MINLNNLLVAVSNALDFVEMDILGITSNHSKRVAYLSFYLAKKLGLSSEECFDIVAISILHDNGISEKMLHSNIKGSYQVRQNVLERIEEHCPIGEENIKDFPFLTDVKNIILYHHERFDGKGFFGIKGDQIPIMAQIISFVDTIDRLFNLKENYEEKEKHIVEYVKRQENKLVSTKILNVFYELIRDKDIMLNLKDELIDSAVLENIPTFTQELSYMEIRNITKVLSKIIDCKSKFTSYHSIGLATLVSEMATYYKKGEEEKLKLIIAADLHDIGKLAIPNNILEKPTKLNDEEYNIIKTHVVYTRKCLESLSTFKDITEWASNHHEKLNGLGYPKGLKGSELDFNSRLLGCLDIYQALTEDRPYRQPLTHNQSMEVLYEMANEKLIDLGITKDIDIVFGSQ
ncbi:HD domain-containing protein [Natranaerovirga pectinivora]|uniref:HD domain-containing protein n=1 Tax=Natranaerovirga pectinivora TaxID=682400 RepID=A0A4R3MJZ4_9FIRM|nr:HD domain-containing phosphohydrolase [Natranaerovirga pectinivora]TCT12960.1 HD domain-containing protein [Natranaerovirga pectinivora]